MTPVLLALTLATAPELWAATQGFDAATCDSNALAAAIHAHRPAASVHSWRPGAESPPAGAMRVELARKDQSAVLEVTGAGSPITRTLPANDDCQRNVEIAALIVDGALDDLEASEKAPRVDSVAPPVPFRSRAGAGVLVGAGLEQGPLGLVPALDIGGFGRYRSFELTLDVDFALPATSASVTQLPEAGSAAVSATSLEVELGLGLAPRLGPGRLSVDGVLGLALTFATPAPAANPPTPLFQRTAATYADAYLGLRLGYVFELPLGLFAGARVEERLAPVQATFGVFGDQSISTRTLTFQALGLVGYRFL